MYRYVKYGLFLLIFSSTLSAASIRSQVTLLEASENIRLKSQQIAVNYLSYYANPAKYFYEKESALQSLKGLNREFELIDRSTKEEESHQILAVLQESKVKMQTLMDAPMTEENLAQMLQYSDTMLRAAESVSKMLDFELLSEEAKIVVNMKNVSLLMEKMTKYYMVIHVQNDNQNYAVKLSNSVSEMETALSVLNDYNYNSKNLAVFTKLTRGWNTLRKYYTKNKQADLENVVLLASREIQKYAFLLEKYHSKDQ